MNIKAKTRPFGLKHSGWPHSKLSCLATVTEDMSGTDQRQLFRRSGSCQLWSMMVEMGWFWGLLCCLRDWAACSHWSYYEFSIIWLSAWRLCEAICLKVEAEQEVEPFNGIMIQNVQVTAPRQGSKRKKMWCYGLVRSILYRFKYQMSRSSRSFKRVVKNSSAHRCCRLVGNYAKQKHSY